MGCCSSEIARKSDKTHNNCGASQLEQRLAPKRKYSSIISDGSSSGVSSACISPRRSILRKCDSMPTTYQRQKAPKAKTSNFVSGHNTNFRAAFEMFSICDDFGEAVKMQRQQENRSFGYYSESMSTGSSTSTPSQSYLRHNRNITSRFEPPPLTVTTGYGNLAMEMFHTQGFMPKTSSPIFPHRNSTFDATVLSQSYQKWVNYLQSTSSYILHNITDIPEAIAGQFSPSDFPAFTDLEEMEGIAKRFKVDIHSDEAENYELVHQKQIFSPSNATHIIATEL